MLTNRITFAQFFSATRPNGARALCLSILFAGLERFHQRAGAPLRLV